MLSLDVSLFHWINGFAGHDRWVDAVMTAVAKDAPFVYALVLVGCWLSWRPRWQRAAVLAGIAALLALGVGQVVGIALPRARPYLVTAANVLVAHAPDTSFPSDHAILAGAVTIVLATVSWPLGVCLALLSLVVLVSRVYIGVHYPTDVLGGALLGALGAWATLRIARAPMAGRQLDALFARLSRVGVTAKGP